MSTSKAKEPINSNDSERHNCIAEETTSQDKGVGFSVVIIGRNEAKNIAKCIESVIKAANALSDPYEILYVDSASEDDSVAIACKYPVTVIKIKSGEWRCAAAGRAIGTRYVKGQYVAFLDGDMACDLNWFVHGMRHLKAGSGDIGAVTGSKDYLCALTGRLLLTTQNYASVSQVKKFGGSAIISREALSASGGFDPYLIANEEEDLSDRILAAGFQIVGLPCKMITHYGPAPSVMETLRRGNNGYHIGRGQYARRLWSRGQYRKAMLKIKVQIAFAMWLMAGTTMLLAGLFMGMRVLIALVLISIPAYCLVFILRLKNIHRGINMFYGQFFAIPGLVRGLFKKDPGDAYQPTLIHFHKQ